jgi:hypothetical protein
MAIKASIRGIVTTNLCPRDSTVQKTTQIVSSSAETTILLGISGVTTDLTSLIITNATATAVSVTIKDSTAGTTRGIYDLASSGGIVINYTHPFIQTASPGSNWTATLSSAAVTVNITVQGIRNNFSTSSRP